MFSSSPLDWALIALYFGFLAAVWLRRPAQQASGGAVDYLLAGRRITLPALVATLVTTWYGGILGVGEYTWRYGIANWLVFGAPYYLGALIFALVFARRARETRLVTLPDLLDQHYGRGPALMGAAAVFITSAPAAYVLMLGTLFAAMFGLPLVPCVVGAAFLSVFYIQRGGLRTVVLTDQVQFVLMYLGFFILVGFLFAQHGGPAFLNSRVPATHFVWHGGNGPAAILVWYFIALSALVDPGFWQRAYAAKDPGVARRGVLWSIACWMVFDLLTTTSGLYARALLPALADPVFAFPELARITLPPVALGLFYLAMIATVMSTIDSYGFIAATTIGRDVIWRLRGEVAAEEPRIVAWSKWGLWIAAAFATVLALGKPSVVDLWHDLGSVTTPALLLPVGTALLGRGRLLPRWTMAAMAAPFLVSLVWVVAHRLDARHAYPFSLEPIYAGLATSVAIYAAGLALRKGIRS
jgi:SSS family solute:Na+ symporter